MFLKKSKTKLPCELAEQCSALRDAVSVRLHHGEGPQGAKPKAEVIADILESIKERRA